MEEEEIIVCCDCGKDFVLSEGFKKLMIEKPEICCPKRCRDCRAKKKAEYTERDKK